ncbi:Lrp/AsnC family transcriptional regulator [Dokdonia sp. Hel_I_53]|uniref:Lrp/AsnC family transcriptional regulator n=1 Tax=Dokdonia sp. Hel_I_53 TaxID=1566287 RepID=UPI00119A7C16|nr:Lrp/AsnC family transcriptional regulator [Dokdonia sp. Hel_I_53]TVZ51658.1 Lrp/AsnC family leucine-responsive transcriptional regulator [Dokdonia sp. Hel_I_53]
MVDNINNGILRCLQENARQSNTAIGKIVGISSPAVAERIRKMEDVGIIKSYRAVIAPELIGYQLKAIITIRAFMGKLKPFLENVKKWNEVVNCYRITGNENIVMEVVLRDQKHLEEFIDVIITYGESKTQIVLSQVVAHQPTVKSINYIK